MWLQKVWQWFMRHFVAIFFAALIQLSFLGVDRYDPKDAVLVLFWAGSMIAVGFFFGLLFALPRYGRGENHMSSNVTEQKGLDVNTNLLEIADWLTKIIVGLGLVELKNIPDLLTNLSQYVARALSSVGGQQFATALILYFFVLGFLCGYLLTRLELNRLIRAADALYTRPFSEPIESLKKGSLADPTPARTDTVEES